MSELGNLGVDCLLGGDAIDHMCGVTARRGSDSKYSVRWGKLTLKTVVGCLKLKGLVLLQPLV